MAYAIFLAYGASASQAVAWSDITNAPTVAGGGVKTTSEYYIDTQHEGKAVNTVCTEKTFSSEFEYEIGGCWTRGDGFWLTDGGGHAIKRDSDLHASYTNFDGQTYLAANKSHLFERVQTEAITELRIYDVNTMHFSKIYDTYHTFVEYEITSPPDRILQYQDGSSLATEFFDVFYSLGYFSENGEWLAVALHDGRIMVMNMRDLTIRTVRARLNTSDYFANLAVSDNGRYVAGVVYEDDGRPWVYDLEACGVEPITIVDDGTSCGARWLGYELGQAGAYDNGVTFPASLHFYDEYTLGFYVSAPEPGLGEYWEYIIQAPGTHGRKNYVALGDSFASGEGAGSYFPFTDWSSVNECHLSTKSYPYLLDRQFALDSANSIACSGARIKNIIGPEYVDEAVKDDRRTNQHHDVEEQMGYWAPGNKLQKAFIDRNADIVTISVGGNDMGFADIVSSCVAPGTCFEDVRSRMALVATMNEQFDRLVYTYESIKANMRPGSKVYTIGYPEIIEPYSRKCVGGDVHMSVKERVFAQSVTSYLNYIVELASRRAGVVYINMSDVFYGKRLCESLSPAVHGLRTAWRWPPFSPESYHPTDQGQRLMAQAIAKKTNNLSTPMPRADLAADVDWSGPEPVLHGLITVAEATAWNHDTHNEVIDFAYPPYQSIARGSTHTGSMQSDEFPLIPGASYELWMASDPVYLGTFEADEYGRINFKVAIPESTPAGQHTFHLRGLTADGRNIDVRQPIYVIASTDDWDGDGVSNEDAPCYIALLRDDGSLNYEWCENGRTAEQLSFPIGSGWKNDQAPVRIQGDGGTNEENIPQIVSFPVGASHDKQQQDDYHNGGDALLSDTAKKILLLLIIATTITTALVFYKHKRR